MDYLEDRFLTIIQFFDRVVAMYCETDWKVKKKTEYKQPAANFIDYIQSI